jgi:hypothetical protein
MTQAQGQLGFVSFLSQTSQSTNGFIRGSTVNISAGGAFIACQPSLTRYELFRLTIKPPNRQPLIAIGQVVDSNGSPSENEEKPSGMGVRFIHISDEDRQFIFENVPNHLK